MPWGISHKPYIPLPILCNTNHVFSWESGSVSPAITVTPSFACWFRVTRGQSGRVAGSACSLVKSLCDLHSYPWLCNKYHQPRGLQHHTVTPVLFLWDRGPDSWLLFRIPQGCNWGAGWADFSSGGSAGENLLQSSDGWQALLPHP